MSDARLVLVAALARNRVIGLRGGLPWHLPGDLAHFRRVTLGKPLMAGRKTYESIGGALPGRDMIVVSRRGVGAGARVWSVASLAAAVALAQERARAAAVAEICVIGGGELFAALLDDAQGMILTHVQGEPQGDVWFPQFAAEEWREISRTRPVPHPSDSCGYEFSTLRRR